MTGGRIGRVNMKLADNLFDMSGGIIDRNLVAGFGNDTIILSGGTIGGNISVSGGTDSVTITGGSVGGDVLLSVGTDSFTWDGGGVVHGTIDLGGDNDSARLADLTAAHLGRSPRITGGDGSDTLVFDNVTTGGIARTEAEVGAGLIARFGDSIAVHVKGDYALDADGPRSRRYGGTVGVTISW